MYLKSNPRKKVHIITFLFMLVQLFTFVGGVSQNGEETHLVPVIVLSDSTGRMSEEFTGEDSLYASVAGLEPGKNYTLEILRSDGEVIFSTIYASDRFGIIPNVPLWQDIGSNYGTVYDETGKEQRSLFDFEYRCLVKIDNRPVAMASIRVREDGEVEKIIDDDDGTGQLWRSGNKEHVEVSLTCQAPPRDIGNGEVLGAPNPMHKNNFSPNEEVWVAIRPFIRSVDYAYKHARVYVVNHKEKDMWRDGMGLADVSGGYETLTIKPGCSNFNYLRVWEYPVVRDEGYDVVVDFEPFGVYDKGHDILDRLDQKGFTVPSKWITLESVAFNHEPDTTSSDAINIRENNMEDVHVPEWKNGEKPYAAAYIKKKKITVKAVFSAASGVTTVRVNALKKIGRLGNVKWETVSFNNGIGTMIFEVTGKTPNKILSFLQEWKWYCKDVNGSGSSILHIGSSRNKIFVVLAQPQAPWTTSGQSEPWVNVLSEASEWAWGANTPEMAAAKITKHIFLNVGAQYDVQLAESSYPSGNVLATFDLTGFLANIPNIGDVNCYDTGKSLVTFSNVLGCGVNFRYSEPFGYENCIYAIGRGWTNNPCYEWTGPIYEFDIRPIVPGDWSLAEGRCYFGNHTFGSIGDNIFDACLKVDTDNEPDYGPPFKETWMINEPWESYKTKVVDDDPPIATAYPTVLTFTIY